MKDQSLKTPQTLTNEGTNTGDALVEARKEGLRERKDEPQNESFKWLNENSRKFLASGYLKKGVSPEERIREVADRAEEILGIPISLRRSKCALLPLLALQNGILIRLGKEKKEWTNYNI